VFLSTAVSVAVAFAAILAVLCVGSALFAAVEQ
jgi:hypothetical protein